MNTNFLETMPLVWVIGIFLFSSLIIALAGTRLAKEADRLADITGLGEALIGAVLLGGITSLSGIVTSVTAAYEGHPHLSVSNAIGGIALQTVFLAIADIFYRKANLEHASASLSNIMQSVFLIILLSFLWFASALPPFDIGGVHPASVLMVIIYFFGQNMISEAGKSPMWRPVQTSETKPDIPDESNTANYSMKGTISRLSLFAFLVCIAGYLVAQSAINFSARTGFSESVAGGLFTALSTSLPELIVSIAAVRQGALTLAVANIIGGNTFDILFVAFSDFAYTESSIIHTFGPGQYYILSLTLLLTSILTLGLIDRQRNGIAGIGWESFLIIVVFLSGYVLLINNT